MSVVALPPRCRVCGHAILSRQVSVQTVNHGLVHAGDCHVAVCK